MKFLGIPLTILMLFPLLFIASNTKAMEEDVKHAATVDKGTTFDVDVDEIKDELKKAAENDDEVVWKAFLKKNRKKKEFINYFLLDAWDVEEEAPLFVAAQNGSARVAQLLLKYAEKNDLLDELFMKEIGDSKWTVLHELASLDSESTGQEELKFRGIFLRVIKKAKKPSRIINSQEGLEGNTPLHIAASYENSRIMQLFVKYGANPSKRNHASKTPAMLVSENEKKKVKKAVNRGDKERKKKRWID